MAEVSLLSVVDWAARIVFACSLLSLLLPAVEDFNEFPGFQRYYRLFCKIILKWGSLDLRGKILQARGIIKNGGNGPLAP